MILRVDGHRNTIDTEFPAENNSNKVISINSVGILMDHGDPDGTFMFYPWARIIFVATNIEEEKIKLGGLK